ncbi:hypothetical protein FisN_5Lu018 [Fistulifera solaris]|uniref:Uncharacterized protein n=1 Tax=Fistulifera solaris TaxID=1519565 RepID=A0A1Z5JJP4_FISSO|nr:hypothetical protein FisN_5Lu018 [Fistulifera solaris]|eukprot:GAX14062.1 hypothetical protein FisN_5Lu018 [Fistulifera solaris]
MVYGATESSLDDATVAVPCLDSMRWSRIDGTTLQSGVVQPSVTRIDVAINCEFRSFGDFLVHVVNFYEDAETCFGYFLSNPRKIAASVFCTGDKTCALVLS